MRNILFIAMILCTFLVTAQRPAQLGIYDPTGPNAMIKRVIFSKDSNGQERISIHTPCGTGKCYWGRFNIKRDPNLYERVRWRRNHKWLPYYETFSIDQGFVKRSLDILMHTKLEDHIRITIRSDFKDPKKKDSEEKIILKLR